MVDDVSVDAVDELAAVLCNVGVWDGAGRAELTDLIGWHLDVQGDLGYPYPVVARWLGPSPPLIAQRLEDVAEGAQAGRYPLPGPSRPMDAVHERPDHLVGGRRP